MNSGDSATFNCSVSGSPIESVRWLRNAEPVLPISEGETPSGSRIRLLSQQVLHISGVSRSDRGMYQCFVRNDKESAQGSAELRLGGEFCGLGLVRIPVDRLKIAVSVRLYACGNLIIAKKICMKFLLKLTN